MIDRMPKALRDVFYRLEQFDFIIETKLERQGYIAKEIPPLSRGNSENDDALE